MNVNSSCYILDIASNVGSNVMDNVFFNAFYTIKIGNDGADVIGYCWGRGCLMIPELSSERQIPDLAKLF